MMAVSVSGAEAAWNGLVAREHLVEDGAERELVAPEVDGVAPRLLGRHVGDRPEDGPLLADGRERRRAGVARIAARDVVAGEAEVEDLDAAVLRQEDVLGLDVAVDDSLLVRGGETVGDLRARSRGTGASGIGPLASAVAERLAFEQLLTA